MREYKGNRKEKKKKTKKREKAVTPPPSSFIIHHSSFIYRSPGRFELQDTILILSVVTLGVVPPCCWNLKVTFLIKNVHTSSQKR